MAKRISISTLNASTIDILNTIRQNASYQYQQNVPEIDVEMISLKWVKFCMVTLHWQTSLSMLW